MKRPEDSNIGKALLAVLVGMVIVAVAHMNSGAGPSTNGVSASDRAAVAQFFDAPAVKAHGVKPGELRLIDSAVQGDDRMDVLRDDTEDSDGPMSIYFVIENGKLVDVQFAQNGTAQ